ncbi:MAG: mechanosensitive ion channel [Deltaproteobacteria bacterium]|nr:mechanosensitive ion channel [Deltaproteobacteria bacterium]
MENFDKISTILFTQLLFYGPKIALALLVFFAFWVASKVVSNFIMRIAGGAGIDTHIVNLFRQTSKSALLIFGGVTALGTAGINVSGLVAGLGLLGFAIGFALKDALSNLLSGVLILIYQPFKVGEEVEVAGLKGVVTNIDLRYTTLKGESEVFLIPNSTLFTKPITISSEDKMLKK